MCVSKHTIPISHPTQKMRTGCGNRGWLVLTKDRKFHNRILEITAIARSKARVFKLTQLTCKAQKWRPYLSKRSERLHVWQLATVAIHSNC